jgi:hypothetical protein
VLGGVEVMPRMESGTSTIQCVAHGLKSWGLKPWRRHIALTSVCRAIHRDTRLLPYSLNIIKLGYCLEVFTKWLSFIGEARTAAIETVYVKSEHQFFDDHKLIPVLNRLQGLKRLVFHNAASLEASHLLKAYACGRKLWVRISSRVYSVEEMLWDEHDPTEEYDEEQEDEYADEDAELDE